MSTGTHFTRRTRMSVRDLIAKKRKAAEEKENDPASKKTKVPISIAVSDSFEAPGTRKVTQKAPQESADTNPVNCSDLTKFYSPKAREERVDINLNEMVTTLPLSALKLLQDSLGLKEKFLAYQNSVNSTASQYEALKKENAITNKENARLAVENLALEKKSEELRQANVELNIKLSKAAAEKAKGECEIGKLVAEQEDLIAYYGLKARVEMIEDYQAGKAGEWDLEAEKRMLDDLGKDMGSKEKSEAGEDAAEVQSKKRADLVEDSGESSYKAVNTGDLQPTE